MHDYERNALTAEDFLAAGVEAPRWAADPIPTLEVWRRWREAEDKAMAHKRVLARAAERSGA
jgi:hypothetical protein